MSTSEPRRRAQTPPDDPSGTGPSTPKQLQHDESPTNDGNTQPNIGVPIPLGRRLIHADAAGNPGDTSDGRGLRPVPGTTGATIPPGLAERAVHVARAYRAVDPNGFDHRHDDPVRWGRWARRARVARTIAAALQIPADQVTVTDDTYREHRTRDGHVPGDLIIVADPATEQTWRFITDPAAYGNGWFLITPCPECGIDVPATPVATLADLGEHLDPDTGIHPCDRFRHDPAHLPDCTLGPHTTRPDTTR
ncbi:hypothetical protein ACQPYE_27765 [Actinosynnema sp. CA-299493]